jgi:SAM-dependent methyltransferase
LADAFAALKEHVRDALDAEAQERTAVQRNADHLSKRIAELASRLARLDRALRTSAGALQPTERGRTRQRAQAARTAPAIDYFTFESRFRPEQDVVEHQRLYVDLLRGYRRVVDLGCGRGELLELLRDSGVSAYGVDVERDFILLVREKGFEVVDDDAVTHVEGLAPGAVDAITASHLIEHLPPEAMVRLVAAAADRLPDDGILVLETPNPESLLAGSVNFHRDPTHVHPIHPDTLTFLCESAGFDTVEVRRLSPVPAEYRLPSDSPNGSKLGEHLDRVIEQLNEFLYGYQDYAVIARK